MGKIIENYSLQEVLGQGVYGKVYRGVNIKTKDQVAVKVIRAEKFKDIPKLEQCTVNQISALTKIEDNPHIVKYIDMLKTVNNYYFVYEYCNGGTLEKVMQNYRSTPQKVMPQTKAIYYFKQIVEAFKSLTKLNIMHRDLKPDNILLHNGIIKIADFGFCKSLNSPQGLAQTMLGSPLYMAPQVLKGEIYTMKADIWSLGVVLFEMLIGQCPYKSGSIAKLIQVLDCTDAVIPKTANPNLQKLLRRMLVKDPQRRIEWPELFEYKLIDEPESKNSSTFTSTSNTSHTIGKDLSTNSANNNPRSNNRVIQNWQQAHSQDGQLPKKRSPQKHNADTNNYSLRSTLTVNPPQQLYISKSPLVETTSTLSDAAMDHFLNSHKKVSMVVKLSLEVIEKNNKFSTIVSYFVVKAAEKQLNDISSALKKQIEKPSQFQHNRYWQFKNVVERELQDVQNLINFYREEIVKGVDGDKFATLMTCKSRYLKLYIQGLKLDSDESIDNYVHASQLLDYFQQSILLKKDAYQRLSRQQLSRQINTKLIKL